MELHAPTHSLLAQENGKAVRQLTIKQTNTKRASGILPLNMYRNVGGRIPTEAGVLAKCAAEIESANSVLYPIQISRA